MMDNFSELEKVFLNFTVKLRMLDGFDRDLYERLCSLITECSESLENQDHIPKKVAAIFFDSHATMLSALDLYSGQDSENIMLASDNIAGLIRQCLNNQNQ